MKPNHYVYLILIIGFGLSGCASTRSIATPIWTETQPPLPTSITPTLKTTSTPRPSPTLTLSPPATLEPEQAKETIKTLLQEPVDCEAPCFWGITPGQTTLGEAKNIFTRLGLQREGERTIEYDFESGLSIGITLKIQKDWMVENLTIYVTPEIQRAEARREWSAFSPDALINRYGPPSKVDFFIGRAAPNTSYAIAMYFDAVNLIVEYYSYDFDGTLRVCPLIDQMSSIRIWMGKNPQYPPLENVPLAKATSLTMDEYTKLMTGNPDQACFSLKEEAFQ